MLNKLFPGIRKGRVPRAVFHVGVHKTGSTMLQGLLRRNREQLAELGFETYAWRDFNALLPEDPKLYASAFRTQDVIAAAESFRTSSPRRGIVYSEEAMLGPMLSFMGGCLYPEGPRILGDFVRAFDASRTDVILYVRRQDTFLESVYLQQVKEGRINADFPTFMKGIDPAWLRWDELIERLEAVLPSSAKLHVKCFETIRSDGAEAFCRDFAATVDSRLKPSMDFKMSRNRGYSDVALRIARAANEHLDRKDRKKLRRFLSENFNNVTHPAADLLDDVARQRILEALATSNRALGERVGGGAGPVYQPSP